MSYIDRFIIAVPEANKQTFVDHPPAGGRYLHDPQRNTHPGMLGRLDSQRQGHRFSPRRSGRRRRSGGVLPDRVAGLDNPGRRHGTVLGTCENQPADGPPQTPVPFDGTRTT